MKYTVHTFPNLRGGLTDEYRSEQGETLVYVDYKDGVADVTVFEPYKGHSKCYKERETVKAQAIADKHLAKNGYTAKGI